MSSSDSRPTDLSRRSILKSMTAGSAATLVANNAVSASAQGKSAGAAAHQSTWAKTHDRVFLGGDYWANPMEDWVVQDGAAVCESGGGDRNVHLLTHQLTNPSGSFTMSIQTQRVAEGKKDGGVGFKIGTRADINEHRANCFAHNGIVAGVVGGQLQLGPKTAELPGVLAGDVVTLHLPASQLVVVRTPPSRPVTHLRRSLLSSFRMCSKRSSPRQRERCQQSHAADQAKGGNEVRVSRLVC